MNPTQGVTEVKVTNLEFSYKSKKCLRLSLYSRIIKTFVKFQYSLIERSSRYSYQQGICWSVRPSVEALFVHTLFLSWGQSFYVKVYKTSYFEDPLMDFIHIWHDGRYSSKVFIGTIPTPGVTCRSRSRTSNFHKNVKIFVFKFIYLYHQDPCGISFIFDILLYIGLESYSA